MKDLSDSASLVNLDALLSFSVQLNDSKDQDFVIGSFLLTIMGKLRLTCAAFYFPQPYGDSLVLYMTKGKAAPLSLPWIAYSSITRLSDEIHTDVALKNQGYTHIVPLWHHDVLLAVVGIGTSFSAELTASGEDYISLVASITASALHSAQTTARISSQYNDLQAKNQLLEAMFEVNREFSSLLSKHQIMQFFSYRLMGQMMVNRFAIALLGAGDKQQDMLVNRFLCDIPYTICREICEQSAEVLTDFSEMSDAARYTFQQARIVVVSKMVIQGKPLGVLFVGQKLNRSEFSALNIQFISALGNIAIASLENARLFHEEVEKKRMESELAFASEIQRKLLPLHLPNLIGFESAACSISSKQVGGDYYDFIPLDEHHCLVAIADVSGKGAPAALLMASVQSALRALAPLSLDICDLVERINSVVYNNTAPDKFITFFCGILNTVDSVFQYVNAGHNPPLHIKRNGECDELSEGGVILGVADPAPPYSCGRCCLDLGDMLLLYTDGVTEAMNMRYEEFGEERMTSLASTSRRQSPNFIMEQLIEAVRQHSDGAPQSDDITIVVITKTNPESSL